MIDFPYALMVVAEGGAPAAAGQQSFMSTMIMIGLMVLIFYVLIMRPQQKKQKEHQEMLGSLKKGDRIMTNGGIYGTITGLDETSLTVEIADRVRIKVARTGVAGLAQTAAAPAKNK